MWISKELQPVHFSLIEVSSIKNGIWCPGPCKALSFCSAKKSIIFCHQKWWKKKSQFLYSPHKHSFHWDCSPPQLLLDFLTVFLFLHSLNFFTKVALYLFVALYSTEEEKLVFWIKYGGVGWKWIWWADLEREKKDREGAHPLTNAWGRHVSDTLSHICQSLISPLQCAMVDDI